MPIANANQVTKRVDVDRRLTYAEMDENFQQVKNLVQDIVNMENTFSEKLDSSVYNAKMNQLDSAILAIQGNISNIFTRLTIIEDIVQG